MSSFVTVKWMEQKKKVAKKAFLPPALTGLKLQLARLFDIRPPMKIEAIYDPDGNLINSISDIISGMELMFSTNPPEQNNQESDDEVYLEEEKTPEKPRNPPKFVVGPKKIQPPPGHQKPIIPPQRRRRESEEVATEEEEESHEEQNNIQKQPKSKKSSISKADVPLSNSTFTSRASMSSPKSKGNKNDQEIENNADDQPKSSLNKPNSHASSRRSLTASLNSNKNSLKPSNTNNQTKYQEIDEEANENMVSDMVEAMENTISREIDPDDEDIPISNEEGDDEYERSQEKTLDDENQLQNEEDQIIKETNRKIEESPKTEKVGPRYSPLNPKYSPKSLGGISSPTKSSPKKEEKGQKPKLEVQKDENLKDLDTNEYFNDQSEMTEKSFVEKPNESRQESPPRSLNRNKSPTNAGNKEQPPMSSPTVNNPPPNSSPKRTPSPQKGIKFSNTESALLKVDLAPRESPKPKAPERSVVSDSKHTTPEELLDPSEIEKKRLEKLGINHDNIIQSSLAATREEIVSEDDFRQALYAVSPIMQRAMSELSNLEQIQLREILRSQLKFLGELPSFSQNLERNCFEFLNTIMTYSRTGSVQNVHAALVGPRSSGKSTVLRIVFKKLLNMMAANGTLKHTFCFFIDAKDLLKDTVLDIYLTIVRNTIAQMAAQRLDFRQHADLLLGYYEKFLTLDNITSLPPKFALEDDFRGAAFILQEMNETLFTTLNKQKDIERFMMNAIVIPLTFSQAFGYSKIVFGVDHMDVLDVNMPEAHYSSQVPLIEYFKMMISDGFYIISCEDEERLYSTLDSITEQSIKLLSQTTFTPIYDMDQDDRNGNDVTFLLNVEGEKSSVQLRLGDCGGCSGYVSKWNEIATDGKTMFYQLQKEKKQTRQIMKMKLQLLKKLRTFASTIFEDNFENKLKDFEVQVNEN